MGLKIKMHEENGEKCIEPELLELLISFGQHKEFCEECQEVMKGRGKYCSLGDRIMTRVFAHKDVEYFKD